MIKQCKILKFDRELKKLTLQYEPPKKEGVGFSKLHSKKTKSLMLLEPLTRRRVSLTILETKLLSFLIVVIMNSNV